MWEFHIEEQDYGGRYRAALLKPSGRSDTIEVAKPFQISQQDASALIEEPFIELRRAEFRQMMQAIVDECWKHGIRPTGVDDFRRENDARGAHLADMRHLVGVYTKSEFPK